MAIASCSVKLINRGQGRSAVAAAAYRSGTKLQNEYDGLSHDYTRKSGIAHTAILAPQNAPDWVYNRAQLWNQAELTERRSNSRLAREVMIALPRELSQDQNVQLARAYARVFVEQGMVADLAIHDSRDGNPHAHIMLTTRLLDGDKFGKKCRDWDSRDRLVEWREQYAELTNQYLERYGHNQRIDARSYAAQGINQIPTIHLGAYAHRMKQQGVYTERWEINQRIEEQNKEIAEISKQIEACEKEAEKLNNEIAQEEKRRQSEIEKDGAEAQERSQPEPASTYHNRLLKGYVRVAQSLHKDGGALQDILTEKGIQDFAGQEKNAGDVRELLPQHTPELSQGAQPEREEQEQTDNFRYRYGRPAERLPDTPPQHTRGEESEQEQQRHPDTIATLPQNPEQEPPSHHPRTEEPERQRQLYDAPGQEVDAAKQKRQAHRLVRDPERQNRRYQACCYPHL